jgi:ABC-type nickel/cobalt efflux system permease component RcnA
MGVAGGLVPSPSALVVLMASIGLGRTIFGVVLVIAYGVGMALTLTAVGLALVGVRDRLDRRLAGVQASTLLRTVARTAPVLTAGLVLVVGVSLMLRGIVVGA